MVLKRNISKKNLIICLCLNLCVILCGCGSTGKEEFAILHENMEKEEPYLSQENLEEQLKTWLNEYIYFEGGVSYEAPLLAYKGERLDYVVFHQRQWDSEETKARYKKYRVLVLLQPRNETLLTSMLSFSELFGTDESEKSKIWYTGTLSVGNGEEPQYMDFEGKKEQVDEICISVEDFLRGSEISGNVGIYIRNFNEHDGDTEILIESKDSDDSYILLPYCFYYKELNLQKPMELKKDEFFTYLFLPYAPNHSHSCMPLAFYMHWE